MVTTVPNFGGKRVWFRCPITQARVLKLHLPTGRSTFASREAYNLAYSTQCETPQGRMMIKAQKIRQKLGGTPSLFEPFPEKPKNMHWSKYTLLYADAVRASDQSSQMLALKIGYRPS
jgi:hypothetical protein